MSRSIVWKPAAIAALLAAVLALPSAAQQSTGVPNALQGFSQNREQPVQIEAAKLEVRDKDKVAVFSGNVVVTQGDTIMRCKELLVFYDQEDAKDGKPARSMKAAQPGPGGRQSIRRLEARGGVVVIQKEQTATGQTGIFEMKTNTVTLTGGVVISQGQNVLRGERLVVDLTTSFARVEGGRVQGLFSTSPKETPGKETPGPKTSPKNRPGSSATN